jgi:hypothetical protein
VGDAARAVTGCGTVYGVASLTTTITEVVTGLGMVGHGDLAEALAARPATLHNVSPAQWEQLAAAFAGGGFEAEFAGAWANGVAFLEAADGLRGRKPLRVEWKGSIRAPGDDVIPADLRVDHVYLVSCKYLSRILINASPSYLFDRLLGGGQGRRSTADWYALVANKAYQALYEEVRTQLCGWHLPTSVVALEKDDRAWLKQHLTASRLVGSAGAAYTDFCAVVALETTRRWQEAMEYHGDPTGLLWRLLRLHAAPYFVLGSSASGPMRLRIATPWDWKRRYDLRTLEVAPQPGGQPRVRWAAAVRDRYSGADCEVAGHVEIRWSHGRFSGPPEAKVYLDTPHAEVPGFEALV